MALAWASIGHFVFLFGLHPQEKYLLSTDPQSEIITMMTHRKSENHSLFYLYLDFCILVLISILLRFCIWDIYEKGYFSFKLEEFKSDPGENKLNPPPHQTSLNQKPMFSFCKQNIWNLSAVQNSSPFSNENRFIISERAAYIPLSWV